MPKLKMNTTLNYSPNFDVKKRRVKEVKFIIFHYTGMKKENQAITRLTNTKSKVSSHYLIKNNGEILTLVPDLYIAWHAGVSSWKNYKSINKYSIGIEISNPGHEYFYKKFSKKQIKSILKLSTYLRKKYKIKSNFILGHSDIAPNRKMRTRQTVTQPVPRTFGQPVRAPSQSGSSRTKMTQGGVSLEIFVKK